MCCSTRVSVSIIVFVLLLPCTVGGSDPCFDYIPLNDTTLTTDNTSPGTNPGISDIGWYRVTSSPHGLLVRTCPTGNECGTTSQAWMNDTIPDYFDGEVMVTVCIRGGVKCCDRKQSMRMKNCNGFVVYFLIHLPMSAGFCFDSTENALLTVITTQSTTPSDDPGNGPPGGVIAASVIASIAAVGLVTTAIVIGRIMYKRNKITDSQEPPSKVDSEMS